MSELFQAGRRRAEAQPPAGSEFAPAAPVHRALRGTHPRGCPTIHLSKNFGPGQCHEPKRHRQLSSPLTCAPLGERNLIADSRRVNRDSSHEPSSLADGVCRDLLSFGLSRNHTRAVQAPHPIPCYGVEGHTSSVDFRDTSWLGGGSDYWDISTATGKSANSSAIGRVDWPSCLEEFAT